MKKQFSLLSFIFWGVMVCILATLLGAWRQVNDLKRSQDKLRNEYAKLEEELESSREIGERHRERREESLDQAWFCLGVVARMAQQEHFSPIITFIKSAEPSTLRCCTHKQSIPNAPTLRHVCVYTETADGRTGDSFQMIVTANAEKVIDFIHDKGTFSFGDSPYELYTEYLDPDPDRVYRITPTGFELVSDQELEAL